MSMPYSHIESSMRALAGQAEGFGRFAMGGLHGSVYHVTSLDDDGPGSLREACKRKEPSWIVFDVSGTIRLSSSLRVTSFKTIDGRGRRIKLTGNGLHLKECEHVILCNLEFEGGEGPNADAIQIKPKSRHVWIDRCSLSNYSDGLIDISRESTEITISRCYFSQHNKAVLIGADASHTGDRCMRVTIHHCFFDGTRQRHPRVRFARVHLYNNYTRNWGICAVACSVESQILSQGNIYEAREKKLVFRHMPEKAADKQHEASGCIRSEGDLFLGGAQSGLYTNDGETEFMKGKDIYPKWVTEAATELLRNVIKNGAGWQDIARPEDTPA